MRSDILDTDRALQPLLGKLRRLGTLPDDDAAAIAQLPWNRKELRNAACIVRQGESVRCCTVLLRGIATLDRMTCTGARQILGLYFPGDLIDLQQAFAGDALDTIQVFDDAIVAQVPVAVFMALARDRPAIGRLLWIVTLVDAAIAREWTLNVGRRDARTRLLHFLCEFAVRQDEADSSDPDVLTLPFTQEQLGDALGLTSVHVNRVLQSLRDDHTVERDGRTIRITNWQRLKQQADFNEAYLRNTNAPRTITASNR